MRVSRRYWSAKIYNFWQLTHASLLYMPALFCLAFIVVGVAVFQLDLHFGEALSNERFIYSGNIEEAGDVLGLLLTCMITMTTLVISITMVVLSLSASQLGPRLVRVFMSDRRTKVYFGIFFGTIALCFTCIGILHDPVTSDVAPRLTTSFTFLVCFSNLFVLLAYVNHVALSGIADNIITRLTRELLESINRLAPKRGSGDARVNSSGEGYFPDMTMHTRDNLCSPGTGYIQSIQYDSLFRLAQKSDAFIRLYSRPGDYIVEGQKLGCIYSLIGACDTSAIFPELQEAILIGDYRSATQDIEYSIRHMVEIALRALSPGVNDSFTALTVLDKLTGVLAHLFTLSLPVYSFKSDDGQLRVLGASTDEAELIFEALAEIRHAGQGQRIILEGLIASIATLMELARDSGQRSALQLQLEYVRNHICEHFPDSPTQAILQKQMRERGLA